MWSGGHYNMFVVKGVHTLKCVFSRSGMASLRSLSGASNVSKQNNDMPIEMENPFKQPEKRCILCNVAVDYKNIQLLSQFVSPHTGRIYGRHMTGLCGTKQREVSKAIKKAHSMGFMPVTHKYPQFMKDPIICNVRHMD